MRLVRKVLFCLKLYHGGGTVEGKNYCYRIGTKPLHGSGEKKDRFRDEGRRRP